MDVFDVDTSSGGFEKVTSFRSSRLISLLLDCCVFSLAFSLGYVGLEKRYWKDVLSKLSRESVVK